LGVFGPWCILWIGAGSSRLNGPEYANNGHLLPPFHRGRRCATAPTAVGRAVFHGSGGIGRIPGTVQGGAAQDLPGSLPGCGGWAAGHVPLRPVLPGHAAFRAVMPAGGCPARIRAARDAPPGGRAQDKGSEDSARSSGTAGLAGLRPRRRPVGRVGR